MHTLRLWFKNLACGIPPGSSATTTLPRFNHFDVFFSGIYSGSNHFLLSSFLPSKNTIARVWNEWLLYTSFKYFWNSKFSELKRVRPHTCWMKLSLHVYLMRKSQSTAHAMKQFSTDKYNILGQALVAQFGISIVNNSTTQRHNYHWALYHINTSFIVSSKSTFNGEDELHFCHVPILSEYLKRYAQKQQHLRGGGVYS